MKKAIGDKLCAAVGFSVELGRFGVALDRFGGVTSCSLVVVAMIRIVIGSLSVVLRRFGDVTLCNSGKRNTSVFLRSLR
jgi:hypothetical protein